MMPSKIPKQRKITLCVLFFIKPNEYPIASVIGMNIKPIVIRPIENPAKKLKI